MVYWRLLFLSPFFLPLGVWGATINVTTTANSGAGSFRTALSTAVSGDTINFTVTGTIALASDLPVITQSNLTINGNNSTVSGSSLYRGIALTTTTAGGTQATGLVINDLSFSSTAAIGGNGGASTTGGGGGGGVGAGGGIFVNGTATISNSVIAAPLARGGSGGNVSGAGSAGAGGGGSNFATATKTASNPASTTGTSGGGDNGGAGGGPAARTVWRELPAHSIAAAGEEVELLQGQGALAETGGLAEEEAEEEEGQRVSQE